MIKVFSLAYSFLWCTKQFGSGPKVIYVAHCQQTLCYLYSNPLVSDFDVELNEIESDYI